jgi:4-amino-4-deoxy-L-arabinose transferase-like glycosyltransferase
MKYFGILLALSALLFLSGLNGYQLRSSTEPRVAGIAAEMLIDGDWVVPKLNGTPFLEKPPLSLWLDAAAMRLFGVNPAAVRLASALAGLFTALIVFWSLLRLQQPRALAWLAGMLLITMADFWSNVRQVGEDALLTLGVTLALLAYFRAAQAPARTGNWLLYAAGLAIATLSKGVLGLALPGAVIFCYLIGDTLFFSRRVVLANWLRPAAAALIGLIPLSIWLWLLYQRAGADAVQEVLWANSFGRFGGAFAANGHFEPFYYYLTKLPEIFLPWNILVFLGLWRLRKVARRDRFALFLCCWLLAPFVLLSLSSGKRMVYLLALYPAAAIIAADYCLQLLARYRQQPLSRWARWWRQHYRRAGALILGVVTLLYLSYATLYLPRQDREESFVPLLTQVDALRRDGYQIALYQPSERLAGAMVFYTFTKAQTLQGAAALDAYLAQSDKHAALFEADTPPRQTLATLHHFQIGKRHYYVVARRTASVEASPRAQQAPIALGAIRLAE